MNDALRKLLGALAVVFALTFLTGAVLHAGGLLGEPVIVPATVVESACAAGLLVAGYGTLRGRPWGWNALIYAHAGALVGVLVGVLALALGPGEDTVLNTWYHRVMAALLALGLGGSFYISRSDK